MIECGEYQLELFFDKGPASGQTSWPAALLGIALEAQREENNGAIVMISPSVDLWDAPLEIEHPRWKETSLARESVIAMAERLPRLTFLFWTRHPKNYLKFGRSGMEWTRDGIPDNVALAALVDAPGKASILADLQSIKCASLYAILDCPPFDLENIPWTPEGYSRGSFNALTGKGTAKDPAFMAWDEFELNQLEVIVTRESEADGKT